MIGNVLDFPKEKQTSTFQKWAEVCGQARSTKSTDLSIVADIRLVNTIRAAEDTETNTMKCFAGEIVYLTVLGQPIVMLNSQEAALHILDKKSANTCERPTLIMAGELFVTDHPSSFQPANRYQVADGLAAQPFLVMRP